MHPRSSVAKYLALPLAGLIPIFAATDRHANTVNRRFDFGPGVLQSGYLRVTEKNIYSPESGYGFEPGTQMKCIDRGGKDALRSDFCTSDQPFYFSVAHQSNKLSIAKYLIKDPVADGRKASGQLKRPTSYPPATAGGTDCVQVGL